MNKKVLIVGLAFGDETGAGVTLRNLFSKLPASQVGIINKTINYQDFMYAEYLFDVRKNKRIFSTINNTKNISTRSKNNSKILLSFRLALRKYLAYYYNNYKVIKLTPEVKRFISEFDPDYIYVVPYNRSIINFSLKIKKFNKIPIVVHFMDDFRKRSPNDPLFRLNEYISKKAISSLVIQSKTCLAICNYMATEYAKIFNKKFHSFHNPINIDSFNKIEPIVESSFKLKIIYTGTIAENNFDTLILFSSICSELYLGGQAIQFDIYTSDNNENIFYYKLRESIKILSAVTIRNSVAHNKIPETLSQYNLLLLPLTFIERYRSVIEFSFPTKVAEYMASSIPTLYLIPEEIALNDYLTNNCINQRINSLNKNEIRSYLQTVLMNPQNLKQDFAARDIANKTFDVEKVSSQFISIFE